jgi:3-oxosteroid 1-dehydrogenase
MQVQEHEVDFLVVGSGGGGMAAAITARHYGLDTLVIEKSGVFGGTTALSGGVAWIPNNHLMPAVGISDSEEEAIRYLKQVVGSEVPEVRLAAYVREAPAMIRFLEGHSQVCYQSASRYADYYAELPGGKPGARSLDPMPYTIRELGLDDYQQLRVSGLMNPIGFSITADEAHQLFGFTWRSPFVILRSVLRFWLDIPFRLKKLPDNRLTLGKALVARLRASLRDANIPLWLNTAADELLVEEGRVAGAVAVREGKPVRIRARRGVLLASGGFAHVDELRRQQFPGSSSAKWTVAPNVDTGDALRLGGSVGAGRGMMQYAWWTPAMVLPGDRPEAFIVGRSFPGCLIVNKAGKRFLNEAEPYEDFVKHQYTSHSEASPSIPAYFVFDGRYRREYPVGRTLAPGKYRGDDACQELFDAGWIRKADTIEGLAQAWGIDAAGLADSVARMAVFAREGKDRDFGKGDALSDRYYSDHRVKPNPCLAALETPPFYAIEIWPGDLGTKGGLVSNEFAQVQREGGAVIPGLYVAGNASASVMGNGYPGAGATIGASMTFGYIAAKHAAGVK